MKLMKAMKKLNFWSKKKRKKKDHHHHHHHYQKLPHYDDQPYYNPPPPPPRPPPPRPRQQENCQCHFCHPAVPSAPPLPPWLEPQQETNFAFAVDAIMNDQELGDQQCISISQEEVVTPANTEITTVKTANDRANHDYDYAYALQQHSPTRAKAAAAGVFGCVLDVGGLLFRCFLPCFHISEPRSFRLSQNALDDHSMEKKRF